MKITVDTNVLLRVALNDDRNQAEAAVQALEQAERVAIGSTCLCEFVWVLESRYGASRRDIVSAVRDLLAAENVVVDRPAVEAGLSILEDGGDFADGIIAFEGRRLGGDTFASFDKKAVRLLERQGELALILS